MESWAKDFGGEKENGCITKRVNRRKECGWVTEVAGSCRVDKVIFILFIIVFYVNFWQKNKKQNLIQR